MESQTKSTLLKKLISVAVDKSLFCATFLKIIKHEMKGNATIIGPLKSSALIIVCLSAGNLSKSLSTLLSDSEYLKNTYNKNAFLLNPEYLKALMICLSAVETNQLSLLHQIENYLYDDLKLKKGHKRSTSQPQIIFSPQKPVQSCTQTKLSRRAHTVEDSVITLANTLKLRPWRSLSNLSYRMEATTRPRSKTVTQQSQAKKVQFSQQTSLPVPCFDYKLEEAKQSQSAIRPITIHHINCEDIQIHEDVSYRNAKKSEDLSEATPSSSATKPVLTPRKSLLSFFDSSAKSSKISNVSKPFKSLNSTSPKDFYFNFLSTPAFGEKLQTKNVLMQAIASDTELRRHSFHSSPRRKVRPNSKKQSLANFIQTIQSSCSSIELDRENAHFLLSEALIGTFEQVKWNQILSQKFELLSKPDKTDRKSSAKIRIGSADSEGSSAGSSYEAGNLDSEHLSEAQIEWGASESHSAESIALTLISKFNDQQLPSASEVLWLVSESQAPQKLLPIPDGFVINPDEHYGRNTIIRGTNIWAAPRAQIIFTLQPTLERKQLMITQNYRCHGCGMKISKVYANKMRLCYYFSKLNCSGCHKNQISMIPAKILQKWDFGLYNVSVFAYQLLDQIYSFPLFRVDDLNPNLYSRVKTLQQTKNVKIQLKFIQDFVNNCRLAIEEQSLLQKVPDHVTDDVDIWTIGEFLEVKNGELPGRLQNIVKQCEEHIVKCEICIARGFICEICKDHKDIIFPFQKFVSRCECCGTCYHLTCWNTSECRKCERLRKRQKQ